MDFRKYLKKVAAELNREREKILDRQLNEAEKTDKKLIPLIKAFIVSCRGGKRIRGALVVLGYELGKSTTDYRLLTTAKSDLATAEDSRRKTVDIYRVAAAYEIFHSAILVHDDIIDRSPMRRGQPSLHLALGGGHYGTSQAISLADYGFFLAFKIISETNFSKESKINALKLFSKIMMKTALGEMLDSEEKADPLVVMKLKTACYTIAGPLQIGAVLAGIKSHLGGIPSTSLRATIRGDRLLKSLEEFGENLGIAFQIQDDILDSEIGSIEKAKKEAEEYKNKALKVLPQITKDPKMSKILKQMAEYLIEREK